MLFTDNLRRKNMKRVLLAGALAILPAQSQADMVPGGSGSPATFPSGLQLSTGDITSGQWIPTCDNDTVNIGCATQIHGRYIQMGKFVVADVYFEANNSATGSHSFDLTWPISGNFAQFYDATCVGVSAPSINPQAQDELAGRSKSGENKIAVHFEIQSGTGNKSFHLHCMGETP